MITIMTAIQFSVNENVHTKPFFEMSTLSVFPSLSYVCLFILFYEDYLDYL